MTWCKITSPISYGHVKCETDVYGSSTLNGSNMASVWIRKATENQPNVDADYFIRKHITGNETSRFYTAFPSSPHIVARCETNHRMKLGWNGLWRERWLVRRPSQDATELHIRAFSSTVKSQTAVQLVSSGSLCSHEGRLHPPSCSSALIPPPLCSEHTPSGNSWTLAPTQLYLLDNPDMALFKTPPPLAG